MAYVNFWKGLAANYSAETHAEGIYQCTDTGDTYIFGVLNSGTAGDSKKIEEVNALPDSPDANTLYLIPEGTVE